MCKPADYMTHDLFVQVKLNEHWVLADFFNDGVDDNAVERADTLASSLQARYANK